MVAKLGAARPAGAAAVKADKGGRLWPPPSSSLLGGRLLGVGTGVQALRRSLPSRFVAGSSPRLEAVLANPSHPRKAVSRVRDALGLQSQLAAVRSTPAAASKITSPGSASGGPAAGSTKSLLAGAVKGPAVGTSSALYVAAALTGTSGPAKSSTAGPSRSSPAARASTAPAAKGSTAPAARSSAPAAARSSAPAAARSSTPPAPRGSTASAARSSTAPAARSSSSGAKSSTAPARSSTATAAKSSTAPAAKSSTAPAAKSSTASAAKSSTAPAAKSSTAPAAKSSTAPAAKSSTAPAAKSSKSSAPSASKRSAAKASGTTRQIKMRAVKRMPAWFKILEAARGPVAKALAKRVKALLCRGGLDSDVKELVAKAHLIEESKPIKLKSAHTREAAPNSSRSGKKRPRWLKELHAAMGIETKIGRPRKEDGATGKRSSGRHRPKWLEAMVGQHGFKAAEAIWRKSVRTKQEESLIRTKKEEAEAKSRGLPVERKSRSGKRKVPKVPLTPSEQKKRRLVKGIARRANCWLGRRLPPVVRPGKRRRPVTGREDVAQVDEAPPAPAEAAAVAPKRGRKGGIKAIVRRANSLLGRSRSSGAMVPGEDEEDHEGPSTS